MCLPVEAYRGLLTDTRTGSLEDSEGQLSWVLCGCLHWSVSMAEHTEQQTIEINVAAKHKKLWTLWTLTENPAVYKTSSWGTDQFHHCTFADIMTLLRWGKAVAFHLWSSKVNTWSSLIALTNECLNRVLLSAIHWCWSNLMLQAKAFCLWYVHKFKKINKIKWSGSDFKRELAWETSGKLRMI